MACCRDSAWPSQTLRAPEEVGSCILQESFWAHVCGARDSGGPVCRGSRAGERPLAGE